MDNRKIIEEKGAITAVVCAVCLLIIVVVIFLNVGIQNRKASSDKEIQKITNEYNQEERSNRKYISKCRTKRK